MSPSSVSAHRLRCDRCRREVDVTADDLIQFSSGTYPRCCKRPMTLDVDSRLVRPNDNTDLERPALRF